MRRFLLPCLMLALGALALAAPAQAQGLAQFLHRVGAIRNKPESWKDYFFDDPVTAGGS